MERKGLSKWLGKASATKSARKLEITLTPTLSRITGRGGNTGVEGLPPDQTISHLLDGLHPFQLVRFLPADSATTNPSVYFNNFEHAAKGKPGDEFTILNGDFSIREEAGNSFLELPGDPLDTFGLLFGPGDSPALDVSARIWADSAGKRLPEFGIGSNDTSGYKLWLWPANGTIDCAKPTTPGSANPSPGNPPHGCAFGCAFGRLVPSSGTSKAKLGPTDLRSPQTGSSTSTTPKNPQRAKHQSGAFLFPASR